MEKGFNALPSFAKVAQRAHLDYGAGKPIARYGIPTPPG
jgi:hypothetical protein